jgi:hypothetical protein
MLVGAFGASAFGLRGGIPMEAAQTSLYRACIACRHYAIKLITYNPLTHQETRGIDASFKGLRVDEFLCVIFIPICLNAEFFGSVLHFWELKVFFGVYKSYKFYP